MGHAVGQVYKDGQLIGWSLYRGTSDCLEPNIADTLEEVLTRDFEPRRACRCKEPKTTDVVFYSDYGGGFYWPGHICEPCRVVTDGTNFPLESAFFDGKKLTTDGKPPYFVPWSDE